MKIEMYSDYACPFCYIGKRYLEQALAEFEEAESVEIEHKAFELYPHAGQTVTNTTQGRIEMKYGKTPAGAMEMIRHIEQLASGAGLAMNYENVQNTNTFNAHRLTKLAESLGKGAEMNERLFHAYFTENLPLAGRENLIQFATDISIPAERVAQMLDTDEFADQVRADEQLARQISVTAVPFFVIDGKIAVPGSQPPAQFLAILREQFAENHAKPTACGVDGCH